MNIVEKQNAPLVMMDPQSFDAGPTSVGCSQSCDGPTSVGCSQSCDTGPTSVGCSQSCDGPTSVGCSQSCGSELMTSRQNFVAPPQAQYQSQVYQSAPSVLC